MRTADAPDDFRPTFAHLIVPSDMVRGHCRIRSIGFNSNLDT